MAGYVLVNRRQGYGLGLDKKTRMPVRVPAADAVVLWTLTSVDERLRQAQELGLGRFQTYEIWIGGPNSLKERA